MVNSSIGAMALAVFETYTRMSFGQTGAAREGLVRRWQRYRELRICGLARVGDLRRRHAWCMAYVLLRMVQRRDQL
jgi:hypothetical protein